MVVRWLREHGLVTVNAALFLVFVVGMALTGWQSNNMETVAQGGQAVSFLGYVASGNFAEVLFENWESEFLQMGSYVVLTIYLFQRGSPESKPLGRPAPQDEDPRGHREDARAPWPVRRGGVALVLYQNSLLILFVVLFIGAFVSHAIGGAAAYNQELQLHGGRPITAFQFLGTSQFWFQSFQNWQSEFMVIAVLAGSAIFLRQKGSPQSKPVHAPHSETG